MLEVTAMSTVSHHGMALMFIKEKHLFFQKLPVPNEQPLNRVKNPRVPRNIDNLSFAGERGSKEPKRCPCLRMAQNGFTTVKERKQRKPMGFGKRQTISNSLERD